MKQMTCLLAAAAIIGGASQLQAGDILVKDNDKIAFMGDSITHAGAKPGGYVSLVISGLKSAGVKTTAIPAGVSGHKSNQMLARLEKHVLSRKPDWMTLSCGVNDVSQGMRGFDIKEYEKNIAEMVDRCLAAEIKVMILTSTMVKEDQSLPLNQRLIAYNDVLIEIAKKRNLPVADLNAEMQAAIKARKDKKDGKLLTTDGVHMNPDGNKMMAVGVLKAFGLDQKQIEKAQKNWDKGK